MLNKNVSVILLGEAKDAFNKLNEIIAAQINAGKANTPEIKLLESIKNKINLLKENPFYGDNIKKDLIPRRYSVPNLWRIELTQFWRMLYTIRGDQIEIVCFILGIMDHDDYNKLFGYRKR